MLKEICNSDAELADARLLRAKTFRVFLGFLAFFAIVGAALNFI